MMKIKKAREMKKYFGIFAAAFAALSVLSCQREVEPEGGNDANLVSLKILTSVDAKSSLELDGESAPTGRVRWDYGDEITVFDGVAPRHFTASDIPAEGSHVATFDGNVDAGATAFAAVYPYAEGYTAADYAAGVISTAIPSEQLVAAPGSYSRNANVCVAYALKSDAEQVPLSDDEYIFTQMLFHNVGGLLKFTLSQDGVHQSVTIRTADNSALTGAIEATAATGEAVSAAVGAVDYVTIAAENGGFLAAGDYYAVVLPFTDKTVSLEFSNGEKSKKRNSKAVISLDRAAIRDLGTIDAGIDYITGKYVIAGTDTNPYILTKYSGTGTIYPATQAVSINNETGVVTVLGSKADYVLTVAASDEDGLYTIKDAAGYYLTAYSTNNYLHGTTTVENGSYWQFSDAGDGLVDIVATKLGSTYAREIRLNYNSGNPRFTCYKSTSTMQKAGLYPADKVVESLVPTSNPVISCSDNTITITCDTDGAVIYYEMGTTAEDTDDPTEASAVYDAENKPTITSDAYVKAFAVADGYAPSEVVGLACEYGSSSSSYVLFTGSIEEGDYVIVSDGSAMKAAISSNRFTMSAVSVSNNTITDPDSSIVWHVAASGNYWTLYNEQAKKYAGGTGSNNQGALLSSVTDYAKWTFSYANSTWTVSNYGQSSNGKNSTLRRNGTFGFGTYGAATGTAPVLYKFEDNTDWVLDAINVTTPPTKTVYEVGDSFDASGMVVSATYVDEVDNTHTKVVVVDASELTIVAPDMTTGGAKSVSISWEEKNTTQAITVIEWGVDELEITTPPDKVNYSVGDTFDPDGMVVVAHYVDLGGSSETKDVIVDKESLEFTPSGALVSGTTYVRISFEGKSVNQPISVADWVLDSITITTAPTKTTYSVGETFNPSGMVVTAHYVDNGGSADPVDEFVNLESLTIPTNALTLGTTSVTIGYTFKDRTRTASQAITVIDSAPSHSVTFNQLASSTGCTYTVSAGGSSVTSGGDVTEGAEVTLAVANLGTGYTFSSWLVTKADDVNTTVTVTNGKFTMPAYDVKIFASFTVTDNLTRSLIGVTGTGYTDWTNKSDKSPAVYAGKTAGGNSSIQFNTYSTNNKRGIISSTSGGYVKSVALTWNSNTSNGRSVTVRGSTSEMTMSNFTSAASAVSISKNDSAEKDISAAKYTYVGFQAIGGALYLNNIAITWVVTSD